jgi:hypothetical protein
MNAHHQTPIWQDPVPFNLCPLEAKTRDATVGASSLRADGHALQHFGAVLIPRDEICTSAADASAVSTHSWHCVLCWMENQLPAAHVDLRIHINIAELTLRSRPRHGLRRLLS